MHFYRTLQTINNISIPTNSQSQQNDNMLVEQMVLKATTTIDIPTNFLTLTLCQGTLASTHKP